VKIQRNHIAIGIAFCLIVSVPLCAIVAKQFRIRQFKSIEAQITQHGGSLSWELVDGNYSVQLRGHAATNETVKAMSVILRDLPTGFTLLGPGESRLFHVVLDSSQVDEVGFASLLLLPVEFLFLDGGNITDQTATLLAHHHSLIWLQLDNVSVSEDALGLIRKENPRLRITPESKAK
jgi:hypothetical protein